MEDYLDKTIYPRISTRGHRMRKFPEDLTSERVLLFFFLRSISGRYITKFWLLYIALFSRT